MSVTPGDRFGGFVHVADGRLLDGTDRRLLLRGVGLGNWLLPEGYMWKFEPGGPLSPREIEAFIVDVVGEEKAREFWCEFRARFITEADIARIAAEGFDHVRLAINSRVLMSDDGTPIDDGFALIDRLISWCRRHSVWVVLDLHGAPGGQTGTNIDDSPRGLPELFTEERYRRQTIEIWRLLAARYHDEPVVAGYDLLNEPLPNEYQFTYASELVGLYKELTATIREVDPHHLLIYEGSHWSTNWSIFTEVWDPNSMLQCHKYWNAPDRASIQKYVDVGTALGLPVYMGETGENNLDWMQTAFELYESRGMSWNLWPWKKLETTTSPCSVDAPSGWDELVAYARGLGSKPGAERSWRILTDFLHRLDFTRCTFRGDVVSAVFRRAPIRIPAWGFGFQGADVSYKTAAAAPLPGFRSDDQVTLSCGVLDDDGSPPFAHNNGAPRRDDELIVALLQPGDWLAYDVTTRAAAPMRVTLCLAAEPSSAATQDVSVFVDGEPLTRVETPGGGNTWVTSGDVAAGAHRIRVAADATSVGLTWIDVSIESSQPGQ